MKNRKVCLQTNVYFKTDVINMIIRLLINFLKFYNCKFFLNNIENTKEY